MRSEASFGVVPVHATAAGRRYLIVRHRKGHWGFPKGHAEAGETPLDAARRELREETGIADVRIDPAPTFTETYIFERGPGKPVGKTVTYFVGHVACEAVTILPTELTDFAWSGASETSARLTYPEARRLLEAVESHLSGGD